MPQQLCIYLFGAPQVTRDDVEVTIPRRKTLALLAYLAVTAQPQPRDTLAAMFWPEQDETTARARLRRTLSELKQVTRDVFEADRSRVFLDGELWLDTAAFEAAIAATEQHDHPPKQFCPDCHAALTGAVELYTEDFMAGFTLPDCPLFDEWQFYKTETLRQALAEGLQRLIQWDSLQNNHERAIQYGRRWVALDPWHEPAHRQLMELYARAGQQAAALRQYELCKEMLRDELALDPAPETSALYEAIKARQLEPARAEKVSHVLPVGSPSADAPQHNLPPQLTPFIGREKELLEVKKLLSADPPHRLLTIIGPGGIGKTRMALAVGEAICTTFEDGVYYVSFARIRSPEHMLPALAESLGFRFFAGIDPKEQLLNYLREKNLLLILDNFEHLIDDAVIVMDILEAAPQVSILTTSRERLNQSGEVLYTLGGLAFPEEQSLEKPRNALDYEAVTLLLQSARLARPGFELTPGNLAAAVRICKLVQGMPLAIVLAGAWLESLSLEEIADEIAQSLDFLEGEMRDLPERQRSIRAAFDYSWRRLAPEDQHAFSKLTVFHGGFDRQAAQAVAGATLRTLRTLINKSFVTLNADERYEIHELLRQYGLEKLTELASDTAVHTVHSQYYLDMIASLEDDLRGGRQLAALDEIDADLGNIRLAWMQAVDNGDVALVDRALESLFIFHELRTRNREGAQLFKYAQEAFAALTGDATRWTWVRLIIRQGLLEAHFIYENDYIEARLEEAMALAQAEANRKEIAMCHLAQGYHASDIARDIPRAMASFKASCKLFEELDDLFYVSRCLHQIAYCSAVIDGLQSYLDYMLQCFEIAQQTGNQVDIAHSVTGVSTFQFYAGDYAAAESHAEEAVIAARQAGDGFSLAQAYMMLAIAHFFKGELPLGREYAELGLSTSLSANFPPAMHLAHITLSLIEAITGNTLAAEQQLEASIPLVANPYQEMLTNWAAAVALCARREFDAATEKAMAVIGVAQAGQMPNFIAAVLPVIATSLAGRDDPALAAELLALALAQPRSATGWLTNWPLIAQLRSDLEQTLGAQAFAEAWERGEALEIPQAVSALDMLNVQQTHPEEVANH